MSTASDPPAPGPPPGARSAVTLAFQDILTVGLTATTSRTFAASGGGIQLRIGTTWFDASLSTPLEPVDWPAPDFTVVLRQRGAPGSPDTDRGQASIGAGTSLKLRWRQLPDGEYYFVFDTASRNPDCCLYIEISVGTFLAPPGSISRG